MKLIKFFVCGTILLLMACGQNNVTSEEISTDIVNNPVSASGDEKGARFPKIIFEKNAYDFGEIIQGEKVTLSFKFINEGDADLIVTSARGTCGCTIPKWSKEPIAPGESGEIGVVFDSDGKSGVQIKDITIVTNAIPNTSVLRLKGEVIVP